MFTRTSLIRSVRMRNADQSLVAIEILKINARVVRNKKSVSGIEDEIQTRHVIRTETICVLFLRVYPHYVNTAFDLRIIFVSRCI